MKMARTKKMPALAYLRECFDLDAETGVLTWKVRPVGHFANSEKHTPERNAARWNARYAGKVAGYSRQDLYWEVKIKRKPFFAHRIIWSIANGMLIPSDMQIDHQNGDPTDNRPGNLKPATNQENGRNQKRTRRNTSGVMGVTWHKGNGKWQARVAVSGTLTHLGYFENFCDAVAVRKAAEVKYGYHRNHGRI